MFRPLEIWKSQSMAHIYVRCTNDEMCAKKLAKKTKTKVSTYCRFIHFCSVLASYCWIDNQIEGMFVDI